MYSVAHVCKMGIVNTTWLKIKKPRGIELTLIPFYKGWKETLLMFRKVSFFYPSPFIQPSSLKINLFKNNFHHFYWLVSVKFSQ